MALGFKTLRIVRLVHAIGSTCHSESFLVWSSVLLTWAFHVVLDCAMESCVSTENMREDGTVPDDIESLFQLQLRLAECTDTQEAERLTVLIAKVWEETEASLEEDAGYWQRLSTDVFDRYDTYDELADDWEGTYYKERGLARHVKGGGGKLPKRPPEEAGTGAPNSSAVVSSYSSPPQPSSTAPSAAPSVPPVAVAVKANEVPFEPKKVLGIIDAFDKKLQALPSLDRSGSLPILTQGDKDALVAGYRELMNTFCTQRYGTKYGEPNCESHPRLLFGQDVPSYFANVGGETIFRRKELSIAGLCNLIHYGPLIFTQLRSKHYSGAPDAYRGDEGLALMRRVTGNTVDLDTTVLRCNDAATLNIINMSNRHKKLQEYASSSEFADSKQAAEIAVSCTQRLIEDFSKRLNLSPAQQKARNICPTQLAATIPIARDNSTRGHAPLWHYVNAGQNSFHANVPTMEDVIGALLKAPFHCLRNFAFIHSGVYTAQQVPGKLDDFFEHCVVDSCFNMKWKAIEEYGAGLAHEGTIVYVLEQLQMRHQARFPVSLFDSDNEARDNEIAEMWKLVQEEDCYGKDPAKGGSIRAITLSDVATWVRST